MDGSGNSSIADAGVEMPIGRPGCFSIIAVSFLLVATSPAPEEGICARK